MYVVTCRAKSGAVAPSEEDSPAVGRESAAEFINIPQSPNKPGRNGKRFVQNYICLLPSYLVMVASTCYNTITKGCICILLTGVADYM